MSPLNTVQNLAVPTPLMIHLVTTAILLVDLIMEASFSIRFVSSGLFGIIQNLNNSVRCFLYPYSWISIYRCSICLEKSRESNTTETDLASQESEKPRLSKIPGYLDKIGLRLQEHLLREDEGRCWIPLIALVEVDEQNYRNNPWQLSSVNSCLKKCQSVVVTLYCDRMIIHSKSRARATIGELKGVDNKRSFWNLELDY